MDLQTIEVRAQEFIEENKDLVEDPETSANVLGRIIVHGEPIATSYREDVIEPFADTYEEACREMEEAWRDESVTPGRFKEIEDRFKVLEAEKASVIEGFDFFKDFMDEVHKRYSAKLDEDQQAMLEEFGPVSIDEAEHNLKEHQALRAQEEVGKPSLWRRLFG